VNRTDLRGYERLLLEKEHESLAAGAEAEAPVPAAGGLPRDLIDQANADFEAGLQVPTG
jgi:hypothetical protein